MITENSYDALTNHGVHELFSDTFEGQQFTLQIITYMPSKQSSFVVFLSDGFTWIRGELVQDAKLSALKANEIKVFTVIKFMSEDIKMNREKLSFELSRILETNTRVHNIIGQPIAYQDYKKKGLANAIGSNKISEAATVYKLKEAKQLPTGIISGAIIAKVVRKPDKVNSVLNIMIEDEQKEQIQCCFFGNVAQKYQSIISLGSWYRFQNPVLQINNRKGNSLQLKINENSNVEKVKVQSQKQDSSPIGILKPISFVESQSKPRELPAPEVEFRAQNFVNVSYIDDKDLFVIARVMKIVMMKDNIGRNLHCVDRYGKYVEITLWKEFATEDIIVNETYRFGKMRPKLYKGQVSLQSRKFSSNIHVSQSKIIKNSELKKPIAESSVNKKEKILGTNDIIYTIGELMEKASTSKEKSCYALTIASMLIKFQYWGNNYQFTTEFRKKLFYMSCDKCEGNEYVKTKIEPQLVEEKPVCSNCKSINIKIMWNIKATLVDTESEMPCKINSEIVEKLTGLTSVEGIIKFLKNPEQLKRFILNKLHLNRGVFKISAKLNDKKEGDRFYNVCEYYPDWVKVYLKRSENEAKMAEEAFTQLCIRKDDKSAYQFPIPSFLKPIPGLAIVRNESAMVAEVDPLVPLNSQDGV